MLSPFRKDNLETWRAAATGNKQPGSSRHSVFCDRIYAGSNSPRHNGTYVRDGTNHLSVLFLFFESFIELGFTVDLEN